MPKRGKSKLSLKKYSRNKVLKPTPPSQDEICTRVNLITYEHRTSENSTDMLNINSTESRTELQTLLPVKKETKFKETLKDPTICTPDNTTDIKSITEVEIQNKSATILKTEPSESNEKSYKVLKLEDMINLWNELSKITVPQCRCSTNLKKNKWKK